MNKIFSILLIALLIISSTNVAFAQSTKERLLDCNFSRQITSAMPLNTNKYDRETLEIFFLGITKFGFTIERMIKNENGELVAYLKSGNIKTSMQIKCARQDKIEMIVVEGKVKNKTVIRDDGTIVVDGKCIDFPGTMNSHNRVIANAFQDTYQVTCPYGKSEDYKVYCRAIRNSDVSFSTSVKNIATIILAFAIGRIIPGFDVLFGLSYEIAGLIKKYNPYSTAASFVTTEYTYYKGYFVNSTTAVKKCIATIYTEADYKGVSFTRLFYFVHKFDM